MSVVGRAYVTVRAVTRQVPDDIERGMDKALGNIDAKAKGGEFGAAFSEGAGSGIKDSDHIGDSLSQKIKDVDVDRDGRDVGTRLGQAIGESLLEPGPLDRAWIQIRERMEADADGDGRGVGTRLAKGIGEGAAGLATSPIFAIGTVALPAIQDALGLVSQSAAAAVSLAGTLGPTLAAGAAVGGNAMIALGSTIGAVTLALKTQSDELDTFTASLRPVRDEFRGIGEDVQEVLLPALSDAATRSTAALGPTLRRGLVQTGDAVGYVAGQFANLTEQASFQENLGRIFRSNAVAIRDFGDAGIDAADAFVAIGSAASPLTTRFSAWASSVMDGVNATIQAREQTGQLEDWFNSAGDTAAKWGSVFGNTGRALFETFSAGMGEGEELLTMLDDVTERWSNWTQSVEGQNALANWFAQSSEVMSAAGNALGGLGEGLRNWAGDADSVVATLNAIGDVLPGVGNVLGDLSGGARELVIAISPIVGSLEEVSPHVEDLAKAIAAELGPAVRDLAPDLADVASAAVDVVAAFAPAIGPLGEVANIAANVLAPGLKGVATILDALPDSVTGVIGAMVLMRLAFNKLQASEGIVGRFATNFSTQTSRIRQEMSKTTGAGAKFRTGIAGAVGILGGPWGIALGAATIGLGIFMQKQADAKARVEALQGSLNAQTGALTSNSKELIASELEKAGAFKNAADLGIDLSTVMRAVTGDTAAYNDILAATTEAQFQYDHATVNSVTGAKNVSAATAEQADAGRDLQNALKGIVEDTDSATNAQLRISEALGHAAGQTQKQKDTAALLEKGLLRLDTTTMQLVPTTNNAGRSTAKWGEGLGVLAGSARSGANATRAITRATIAYHKATSEAMRGSIGLEQAIDDASKEMRQGARGFNINTQAGRDNKLALIGIADAASQVTGSAKKQADALERARNQIINLAESQGKSEGQAEKLANKLISVDDSVRGIPDKKDTHINTPGLPEAQSGVRSYQTQLDNLPESKHTYIYEHHVNDKVSRAGGGWIIGPGTSTSDSIPYGNANVSNREFVVNAAAAARNAALLESINSGATVTAGKAGATAPVGGGGDVYYNYYISVINPRTERTSDSIPRSLRRARDLGIVGSN